MTVGWACGFAGAGVLCWPSAAGVSRLRSMSLAAERERREFHCPQWMVVTVAIAAACCAGLVLGPAGGVLAGVIGLAGWRFLLGRRRERDRASAAESMVAALRAVVGELRAGTHPATAAESVAAESGPGTANLLRRLAVATRLGAGSEVVPGPEADASPIAARVVRAWALAERHGLPLAELLDAVRRDAEESTRFATQARARMAGPRASAGVLAVLPLAGIGLGEAMGAGPVRVLGTTPLGQGLLLIGGLLVCAGSAWSVRLTRAVTG